MNHKITQVLFTILFLILYTFAQDNKPCSAEEAKQFDFWIGEWQASWEGGQGVNNISKILGGCVVFEEFNATPSSPLIGKSFSVFSPRSGNWLQTWVDNNGAYLDFTGKWQDDKMILSRSVDIKGVTTLQRMVWYNITADKFEWNWEKSTDGGQTWTVAWKINYTRKK